MKSDYTLRPARKIDSQKIKNLVWNAHLNPTGLDWRRFVVTVNAAEEVIACAQIKPHRDGSRELASLVVDPDYRNQGIAQLIIEHLTQTHKGVLYLMCRDTLGAFYTKFGFIAVLEPDMPLYFQRIARFVSLIEAFQKEEASLLVMKHDPLAI